MFEEDAGQQGNSEIEVLDAEGNFTEDFYDQFSEDDRPTVSRYKRPDELGRSHVELRRKFNTDSDRILVIPGEDATDEQRKEYWTKLGVPETVEGYEFTKSDTISDKTGIEEAKIKAFAEIAKKYNLTPEQYNGVANDYLALIDKDVNDFESNMEIQKETTRLAAEDKLKEILGKEYDGRRDRVNLLTKKYSGMEIKDGETTTTVGEKLMEAYPGIENSPWLTLIFDAIAADMSEDRIKGIGGTTTPSDESVIAKLNELRNHPAYYNKSHPEYGSVLQKRNELMNLRK